MTIFKKKKIIGIKNSILEIDKIFGRFILIFLKK